MSQLNWLDRSHKGDKRFNSPLICHNLQTDITSKPLRKERHQGKEGGMNKSSGNGDVLMGTYKQRQAFRNYVCRKSLRQKQHEATEQM